MSKAPSFQFYPGDYLSSQRVSLLTLEEEGAYIRLLCYCWKNGEIPSDPGQLARLIGKGASTTLATNVAAMFLPKGGSRLVHDKLDELRRERERWIEKSRQGGIKSGQIRKKLKESENQSNHPCNHPSNGGSQMVDVCFEPKGNSSTSSSYSHTHTGDRPSLDEVLQYSSQIGLVDWRAEDWWLDMEAKGWHMGNTAVRNWQAGLTRIKQYWEADGRPMKRPGRNGTPAKGGDMPRWKRIEVLKDQIDTHPGNNDSTYFKAGDKEAKAEFVGLRKTLKALNAEERKEALA